MQVPCSRSLLSSLSQKDAPDWDLCTHQMGKAHKGNQSFEFFCYCCSNICLWFMPGFQPLMTTHFIWGTGVCCLPAWTSAPLSDSEPLLTIVTLSCFLFTHIFSPYYWCPFGKPISYLVHIVLGILAGHSNLSPPAGAIGTKMENNMS